ncbi:hypothetical protein BDZ91DRAFT_728761 [Kalaharituber pfeilii]|nr:hypothetical protein BDZ91DRAFT_728761 [Kalaharituber pfeilii]
MQDVDIFSWKALVTGPGLYRSRLLHLRVRGLRPLTVCDNWTHTTSFYRHRSLCACTSAS